MSRERLRRSVRVRLLLRSCLVPSGDVVRVAYHLEKAEEEAESIGDIRQLGIVYATGMLSDWLAGHCRDGIEAGGRARRIIDRGIGDLTLHVTTDMGLGLCFHGAGQYANAIEAFRQLLGNLPGQLERERFNSASYPAVQARAFLAYSHAEQGDFAAAEQYANSAIALANEVDDRFGLALARLGAGRVQLLRDDLDAAAKVLAEGLADCGRDDLPTVAVALAAELALVQAAQGGEASDRFEVDRSFDVAEDQQIPQWSLDRRLLALARIALARGEDEDAMTHARAACESARAHGDGGTLAWALLAAGEAAARSSNRRPDPYLDEATTLADRQNQAPLSAEILAVRSRCSVGRGRRENAEAAARAFARLGLGRRSQAALLDIG